MKKFLWIAGLIAALSLVFTACPDVNGGGGKTPDPEVVKYAVTFNLTGGGNNFTVQVEEGNPVTRPGDPVHTSAGFTFINWFEDPEADPETDNPYDFTAIITGPKTLYALWEMDTENFYYVTFYAGTVSFRQFSFMTGTTGKVTEFWETPAKADHLFIGWFMNEEGTGSRFDFNTNVSEALDIYAVWGHLSEVIKINEGKGDFLDDWWLGYGSIDKALVKYNNQTAIQIRPDEEGTGDDVNAYRLYFDFDPFFDISQYGSVDVDFAVSSGSPSGFVISLFSDRGEEDPEKVMFFPGAGSGGTVSANIGTSLHFKSKTIVAFEIYSPSISGNPSMYITRVAVSGTAVPEPIEGAPVAATGVYMATSATASSGSMSLSMNGSGDQRVWIFFDPYGSDFSSIELIFTRTASGGNMVLRGAIDGGGSKTENSGSNYMGWMGYLNPPYFKRDPVVGINSTINKATLRAVFFDFELSGTGTNNLVLTGVNFYPHAGDGPPPVSATVSGSNITGTTGTALTSQALTVTLPAGSTFVAATGQPGNTPWDQAVSAVGSNWITNAPAGITQAVSRLQGGPGADTTATITITGTPSAVSDAILQITIPQNFLSTQSTSMTVTNTSIKFSITSGGGTDPGDGCDDPNHENINLTTAWPRSVASGSVTTFTANEATRTNANELKMTTWDPPYDASRYVGFHFEYQTTVAAYTYIDTGGSSNWSDTNTTNLTVTATGEWKEHIFLFENATYRRAGSFAGPVVPSDVFTLALRAGSGNGTFAIRNLCGIKSEGGDPELSAAVSGTNITGSVGTALSSQVLTITLPSGSTFVTSTGAPASNQWTLAVNAAGSNWVTNAPAGITQAVARTGNTTATITLTGTPSAVSSVVLAITIPQNFIATQDTNMPVTNTTIRFDIQEGGEPVTNDPIYLFRNGAFENNAVPRTGGTGANQNSPTEIVGNWLVVKPNGNDITRFRLDFLPGKDLTNYTKLNITWTSDKVTGTTYPNYTYYSGTAGNTGAGARYGVGSTHPNTSIDLEAGQKIANLSSFEYYQNAGVMGTMYIVEISFSTNTIPTPPSLPAAILQSIAVSSPPTSNLFAVGDTFSSAGLVVNAVYAGKAPVNVTSNVTLTMGSTAIDNSYVFQEADEGPQTITVSYIDGSETKTATFTINVSGGALVVDTITVADKPTKRVYEVGDTFASTGLLVNANYQGGGSADVTADVTLDMSGTNPVGYVFLSSDLGTKTITVTYDGKTTTFDIQIYEAPDNTWFLSAKRTAFATAVRAPANVVYKPGNAINDGGVYRLEIYFPAAGVPVTHVNITFETTGSINLVRQGIYNASDGMAGWGNGAVTSGVNIPITGGGNWGWDGANTGQMVGLCLNVEGADALTGEWSFRLTGVNLVLAE